MHRSNGHIVAILRHGCPRSEARAALVSACIDTSTGYGPARPRDMLQADTAAGQGHLLQARKPDSGRPCTKRLLGYPSAG